MTDEKTEVLVPVWVLKTKVEADFQEYAFLVGAGQVSLDDEDKPEPFPIYDSTHEMLKILDSHGVIFDRITGQWKE